MIDSDDFVQALQDIGFNFFTGVPDSILGGIIATLMERRIYTPAVREDEAVAMAAGAFMAGKIPSGGVNAKLGFGHVPECLDLAQRHLPAAMSLAYFMARLSRQRRSRTPRHGRKYDADSGCGSNPTSNSV
jgi:hypothetical protein